MGEAIQSLWNPVSFPCFRRIFDRIFVIPFYFDICSNQWVSERLIVSDFPSLSAAVGGYLGGCLRDIWGVSEGCLGRYLRGVSGGVWGLAVGCLECQSCKSFQFYQSCSWSDCSQRFVLHLNLCRRVLANPQPPFQALPILQSFQSFQSYWVLLRYFI